MAITQDVVARLRMLGASAFTAEADRASKGVGKIGTAAEASGKQTQKAAGRFKRFGGTAKNAAAGLGAFYLGKQVLQDSIGGAVDLGEEISKTGVVFRSSGDDLVKWSKGSAQALGLTQQEALAAAGTMGNMLVPMGFARKRAAGMSKSLVTLAGDLASFNNASPEETLNAVRSGLAGETEPLRRFGVFLNEARVQAEAMSLGLVKTSKDTSKVKATQMAASIAQSNYNKALSKHGKSSIEAKRGMLAMQRANIAVGKAVKGVVPKLTAAQKAQATYSIIMKDTKDAQGDFARTSGSLANQQRILRAQYKNIAGQLGTSLLPVLKTFANYLTQLLAAGWPVKALLGLLTAGFIAYKLAVISSAIASSSLLSVWLLIPLAIIAIGAALVYAYKKVEWFRNAVNAVGDFIRNHWKAIIFALIAPLPAMVILAIKHFDKIKSFVKTLPGVFLNVGKAIVRALIAGIKAAPGAIMGAIRSLLPGGKLGKKLIGAVGGVWKAFGSGGTIGHGTTGIVGERGPELVHAGGAGARVIPLGPKPAIPALNAAAAGVGGSFVAKLYLQNREIAQAVAQHTADVQARR